MICKGNHVKFARLSLLPDRYIFIRWEISYQFHLLYWPFFFDQCIIKQLLDEVFVIFRIIKISLMGYQPKPKAEADNPCLNRDYSGYHKTSTKNCLYTHSHFKSPRPLFTYQMDIRNKITQHENSHSCCINTECFVLPYWEVKERPGLSLYFKQFLKRWAKRPVSQCSQ